MKKINAVTALITSVLLLIHMITMCSLMFGAAYKPWYSVFGKVFLVFFCAHVLLSISVFLFTSERGDLFKYPKENIGTVIQRITALGIIIMIHIHFSNYANVTYPSFNAGIMLFITEVLLVLMVSVHAGDSVTKAFVTLKLIKSDSTRKKSATISVCVFGATAIFAISGLVRFCFGG